MELLTWHGFQLSPALEGSGAGHNFLQLGCREGGTCPALHPRDLISSPWLVHIGDTHEQATPVWGCGNNGHPPRSHALCLVMHQGVESSS